MANYGSSSELNNIDTIIKANKKTFNDDDLKSSLKNDFENSERVKTPVPITFAHVVTKNMRSKFKSLLVLLDSGSSHRVIKHRHVQRMKHKYKKS